MAEQVAFLAAQDRERNFAIGHVERDRTVLEADDRTANDRSGIAWEQQRAFHEGSGRWRKPTSVELAFSVPPVARSWRTRSWPRGPGQRSHGGVRRANGFDFTAQAPFTQQRFDDFAGHRLSRPA